MSLTNNQSSVLYQLRKLVPARPLTQFEAYRLAELQANRLLEAAHIDEPGTPDELVTGLPFLEINLRSDLPASGLTRWAKPRWHIYLNRTEAATRRRYSLMHEFKHVLDHGMSERLYPTTEWCGKHELRTERVCDYFAASLLMPKRLVKARFYQGLSGPEELAGEFGVSLQAMRVRLDQLRLTEPIPRCGRHLPDKGIDFSGYLRRSPARQRVS
jgi:Zn-dependent peptidase ImmA (M78 family)